MVAPTSIQTHGGQQSDRVLLATEKAQLMTKTSPWPNLPDPWDRKLECWAPNRAKLMWMDRFRYVVSEMRRSAA